LVLSRIPHSPLHSFPTRRSSDLRRTGFGGWWLSGCMTTTALPLAGAQAPRPRRSPEGVLGEIRSARAAAAAWEVQTAQLVLTWVDRKSTRLNSSHVSISYAVFCL